MQFQLNQMPNEYPALTLTVVVRVCMVQITLNVYIYDFEDCPGTQSDSAGKASACEGCPNQSICATGKANLPDPGIKTITPFRKYSWLTLNAV